MGDIEKRPAGAERHCVLSILNCPEHFLRHRILSFDLFQFLSGIRQFLHPLQFVRSILQAKMRVGIQRYTDIRMPHQVLKRLWIHAGLCHVAAVDMAANVRGYVQHLHLVDVIVAGDHVVEIVFPMHRHQEGNLLCL